MSRLLNVRLSDEDAIIADRLRRKGVTLSQVVRIALRGEYARLESRPDLDGAQILEELYKKYPAPPNWKRRRLDTADRHQVVAFLRRKLRAQLEDSRRTGRKPSRGRARPSP